jgi:hypothetical protein
MDPNISKTITTRKGLSQRVENHNQDHVIYDPVDESEEEPEV